MESNPWARAFAALGNAARLRLFRLLVAAGDDGMAAGDIGTALGIGPSTLSPHLAKLEQAGLISATRVERRIVYALDTGGVRALAGWLVNDCCGAREDLMPQIRRVAKPKRKR